MDTKNTIEAALNWYLDETRAPGAEPSRHGGGHDELLALGGMLPALASAGIAGVYAWGPPGTGKTRTTLALAAGLCPEGMEPIMALGHPGLTVGDVWGYYLPTDTGARWVDGTVAAGWRARLPVVVDELGRVLGSEAESALLTALSGHRIARVSLPTGETLHSPEGWLALTTGNTPPDELPDALRDRLIAVHVWGPSRAALAALAQGLPEPEGALLIRAVGSRYAAPLGSHFDGGIPYRSGQQYRALRAAGAPMADAARLALEIDKAREWIGTVTLQTQEGF